ncbi:O-antigen ligase [Burkholderia sp. SCN-KJ]|uniref:O-antigen ligase family protein n=1 Tax=Burkholderia sp. SCN-KJ TaxID=2969248 RepID=UPI00214FE1C6|nr:hypothetical protein [Burkholderia sp. SCN-KJ]MCR4469386.1 hypothetical protein [Burkholderia sp. SCN-KJ]
MRIKYIPILMLFCIVPLAFDFKSDDGGGHAAQIVLVVPALLSGLLLALSGPRFRKSSALRSFATIAVTLTVAGSVVPQILQSNDPGNYLRVLLAFLLFMIGFYIGCHPWADDRLRLFRRVIFVGMALSLIFSFTYGAVSAGSVLDARFKIISPVLLGLQGFLLYDIVAKRSATRIDVIVFIATLVVELLSITRSIILGTIVIFCFSTWLASRSLPHLAKLLIRTTAITIFAAIFVGGVTWIISPSVLEHWSQRIFFSETTSNGKDPTTLSRLAEIEDQYDQVTSDAQNLVFGMGYGHEFHFSETYFYDLLATRAFSEDILKNRGAWEAGHNFWVYQLFSGGIAFGVALPVAILLACFMCTLKYRRVNRIPHNEEHLDSLGRYLMVIVGMIVSTIGGNPLGPRYGGLIYGLAFGLMLASYSRLYFPQALQSFRSIGGAPRRESMAIEMERQ